MKRRLLGYALLGFGAPALGLSFQAAFGDSRPALYLKASYPDASGKAQVMEYWRAADGQVVRRTGGNAELRLKPAPDGEDEYELRNLKTHIVYTVHRSNLYRIGTFTDRWSVQHLLSRSDAALSDLGRDGDYAGQRCHWYQQAASSPKQSPLDICWSAKLGLPLKMRAGNRDLLTVQQVRLGAALPSAAVPEGWHTFDVDEDLAPD